MGFDWYGLISIMGKGFESVIWTTEGTVVGQGVTAW